MIGNLLHFYKNELKTENVNPKTFRGLDILLALLHRENIKYISIHVPFHLRPLNETSFAYYLAGLIDGSGSFTKNQKLIIVFNILDRSLAYYLKKKLGYGTVYNKQDNVTVLVVSGVTSLIKVINLINGRFREVKIYNEIVNNILNHASFLGFKCCLKINRDNNLKNPWFVGFSEAKASFQIKLLTPNNIETEEKVGLSIHIFTKSDHILKLVKTGFGGNISYEKDQYSYHYDSTSFGSARKLINYFDNYHLLSNKHINYLKWRKAYILIQNKDYSHNVKSKIIKYKNTMR